MYTVKEIYATLQGEGAQTGRAAVFLRFAGCNLWSGLEKDRATAICQFCDTDFVGYEGPGGGKFADAGSLAKAVVAVWQTRIKSPSPLPSLSGGEGVDRDSLASVRSEQREREMERGGSGSVPSPLGGERQGEGGKPYVVCTGGEPLLQLDRALIDALHAKAFEIAIETNGTIAAPVGIDWICVSPKAGAPLVQTTGNELKLVFPQEEATPDRFEDLDFKHFFLQPMDGPAQKANILAAARYCLAHPKWRLSLQTHKFIGLP